MPNPTEPLNATDAPAGGAPPQVAQRLLDGLNPEQREAVQHIDGPLLIAARGAYLTPNPSPLHGEGE